MAVGLLMLIGPLWILGSLRSLIDRLVIITSFTVLILALVSSVTTANAFSSLAATAAYVFC